LKIDNCAVIVTGGASGMGAATARMLAARGAKVALFDLDIDKAEIVAAEFKGVAFKCNVADEESVMTAINAAEEKHGVARIVINCAGIVHGRRMVNKDGAMPLDEFKKVIEINLVGSFNVMRLAANAMSNAPLIGEERGVIINTASVAAFDGQIGQCAYSASKGGIVGMTLPAARDLSQLAIRVMTIAPGLVDTPMFEKISPEARAALAASVPHPKRLIHPDEFAMLVVQIIENAMLNGEVIRLDGALRMQPK
jgi:NAD(P)-dependent dehydrogenase (short-subunit alcohol dehydrogenase family)